MNEIQRKRLNILSLINILNREAQLPLSKTKSKQRPSTSFIETVWSTHHFTQAFSSF